MVKYAQIQIYFMVFKSNAYIFIVQSEGGSKKMIIINFK